MLEVEAHIGIVVGGVETPGNLTALTQVALYVLAGIGSIVTGIQRIGLEDMEVLVSEIRDQVVARRFLIVQVIAQRELLVVRDGFGPLHIAAPVVVLCVGILTLVVGIAPVDALDVIGIGITARDLGIEAHAQSTSLLVEAMTPDE